MTNRIKHLASVVTLAAMLGPTLAASVGSKSAAYTGGTVTAFDGAKNAVGGSLDTSDARALTFTASDKPFEARAVSIPYSAILDVEYGQKAGRRIGAAIGTTMLVGPLGLLALMSKKRAHFVTVGYTGPDGTDQVAVFEVGKDIVRTTLAIIQARSGKKVAYQDDEARESR